MVVVYSSGSTADPKGGRPLPRRRRAPRPQPLADARPRRRRRALHADAAVLGRRLQLHAHRGHARRRHARVRGAVRARRHPRPDRAGADHPGARLAAHGQGARRPPDLQGPRPVVDPGRAPPPLLPAHPGRGRGPARQLARHDRDARAAHLRLARTTRCRPRRRARFGLTVPGVEQKIVDPVTLEDVAGRRERRAVAARLLADARAPQEGAGRGLHPRRLVPHRRRRLLRRGRALLLHRSDGRPDQVGGHEHHAPRRRARARGACPRWCWPSSPASTAGERGQDVVAAIALSPGETLDEDEARRRGEGGDRLLQGAPPHRRVRRPDRAAVARLGQGRPAPAHGDPDERFRSSEVSP